MKLKVYFEEDACREIYDMSANEVRDIIMENIPKRFLDPIGEIGKEIIVEDGYIVFDTDDSNRGFVELDFIEDVIQNPLFLKIVTQLRSEEDKEG